MASYIWWNMESWNEEKLLGPRRYSTKGPPPDHAQLPWTGTVPALPIWPLMGHIWLNKRELTPPLSHQTPWTYDSKGGGDAILFSSLICTNLNANLRWLFFERNYLNLIIHKNLSILNFIIQIPFFFFS